MFSEQLFAPTLSVNLEDSLASLVSFSGYFTHRQAVVSEYVTQRAAATTHKSFQPAIAVFASTRYGLVLQLFLPPLLSTYQRSANWATQKPQESLELCCFASISLRVWESGQMRVESFLFPFLEKPPSHHPSLRDCLFTKWDSSLLFYNSQTQTNRFHLNLKSLPWRERVA